MATPQDTAKLAQQLQEIERLSRLLGANINTINLQPIEANAGNIEAIFQRLTNQAAGLGEETDYLISNFQKLVGEIKNSGTGVNNTTKALRGLSSITEQISNYQKGYNDLSSKEIDKLKDKVQIETSRLKIAKDNLREEARDIRQKIQNGNLSSKQLQIEQDKLTKINLTRRSTLNLLRNEDITLGELNTKLKESEDNAKKVESTLGLTGATLKGISKIPLLGDIVDTNNALKAAKDNIKEGGDRTSAMKAAFKSMGGQIKTNLTDPLVVVGFLFTQMLDALQKTDKGAGELAKGFNMTYNEAIRVREELTQIGNLSMDAALNTRALQETLMTVGQALGSNAMLNEKDLVTFTKLREQAGFTNDELLGIQKTTLATGGNLEKNAKNILYSAKLTGLNNKVLLNEKDIMRDVAKASDAIKLSLGGSGKKLGEAAAQAKALGMSLEQVDKIAGSLLDFESSITNELSAELITGKQINLEQARLYALNNDMAGLSREIAKNFGSVAEYSKMNRIQQEAAAKAVGMSREELATTLTDQAALKGLSGDKLKDAQAALDLARSQGMTEDQIAKQGIDNLMKQQSVQERLTMAVEKLKEIFIGIAEPIMQIISPIVDILLPVISVISYVMEKIGEFTEWIGNGFTKWMPSLGKLAVFIKALAKGAVIFAAYMTYAAVSAALAATVVGGILAPIIAGAAAATVLAAGFGFANSIKDGEIDPTGKKPILSGNFGSVQLDPKDKAMYGADGTIKVGTNLGGKGNSQQSAYTDPALLNEMRAMRQEQAKANSKPTVIENSVNGTRFGTAVAMNTYKTS